MLQTENKNADVQERLEKTAETADNPEMSAHEEQAPQYTPDETEAMKKGWKPKDQFEGEGWYPAREFLERGKLLDKISMLNRELKDYRKSMQNVEDLIKRREDLARQQTVEELTRARREAIQSGDVETVERLDEDINKARQEMQPAPKNQVPPEVTEWIENHKSWFNPDTAENKRMIKVAAALEEDIAASNSNLTQREFLQHVEIEIKKMFPHRFESAQRNKKPDVETGTLSTPRKKAKYDAFQITDEMRKIAKDFVKKGTFKTEEQYYEKLLGA